ncbi:MAG TPA: DinB family protein [Candidatus Acidoferrum sp.]|nr:DinB family protein [Candidatus Angelobacter sp.]HXD80423.1 DinB family protein [Candidatus Acidoferrum sp.]
MDQLLIEAFRYNKWANLHLLDVCAKLSDDQLQLTAPGTYGTISSTLLHLVAAEQRYLRRLAGTKPEINERDQSAPTLAQLREHAARSGDQLIEVAGRITAEDTIEEEREGQLMKLHLWVVVVQAIHHGNDHRTHICTILGAHDIPYGEMDVWAYGQATGAIIQSSS